MAGVTSATSALSAARYSELIKKDLLEWGPVDCIMRALCDEGAMIKGHSNQYKVNRIRRIQVPLTALTEGTNPTTVPIDLDSVTGTASQYGIITTFTDVAQAEALHDLYMQSNVSIKEAMKLLMDRICMAPFLANTNVVYPSTYSARGSITNVDYLDTDMIRKALAQLRRGNSIFGAAPPTRGPMYDGVIHPDMELALQKDPTWEAAAVRQDKELLEKGIINTWMGVDWKRNNFLPVYSNLADGLSTLALTDTVALTGSAGLDGFKLTEGGSGSLDTSAAYKIRIVRRDALRGHQEGISSDLTFTTTGASKKFTLTMPTADATYTYLYDVHISEGGGSVLYLHSTGNAAAASVVITADPSTSAAVAPVPPARTSSSAASDRTFVIPTLITGKHQVCTVDMQGLEVVITGDTSTPSDVLKLNKYVGAKVFLGAFLQQSAWGRVLEAASPFQA